VKRQNSDSKYLMMSEIFVGFFLHTQARPHLVNFTLFPFGREKSRKVNFQLRRAMTSHPY
jgi:hypothetical protein